MKQELNKLELTIFERLAIEYPFITEHIQFLKVISRENTGVGMYVNFVYDNPNNIMIKIGSENLNITTNETIELEGLEYGLGYEVDITEGKVNFIEFVTFGESWDGVISNNFKFTN